MSTDPTAQNRSLITRSLVATGVVFIAAGVVLAVSQGAVFLILAVVGLLDLGFAWAFSTGKIGVSSAGAPTTTEGESGPDVAAREATDDPSYNPYARED